MTKNTKTMQKKQEKISNSEIEQINSLTRKIARLSIYLNREIELVFKQYDITVSGFEVLVALQKAEKSIQMTPNELLATSLVSSGTMTNRIDRLVKKQLVTRKPSSDDKRCMIITLTELGKKVVKKAIASYVVSQQLLFSSLSYKQQKKLNKLTGKLLIEFESKQQK